MDSESGSAGSMVDPPFGLFLSGNMVASVSLRSVRALVSEPVVFFLLMDHNLEEGLFSSGTDLVKTGLKVFVWSEMWFKPIMVTTNNNNNNKHFIIPFQHGRVI